MASRIPALPQHSHVQSHAAVHRNELCDSSADHDRHRVNQQTLYGGIFLNDAVVNARGLVLRNVPVSAPQSPLERTVPPRAWLATDTLDHAATDDLRRTGFCRRSNPHRSATLLISINTPRGFLPEGLSNPCPQASPGLATSACTGRCRTTLNPSGLRRTSAHGRPDNSESSWHG